MNKFQKIAEQYKVDCIERLLNGNRPLGVMSFVEKYFNYCVRNEEITTIKHYLCKDGWIYYGDINSDYCIFFPCKLSDTFRVKVIIAQWKKHGKQ